MLNHRVRFHVPPPLLIMGLVLLTAACTTGAGGPTPTPNQSVNKAQDTVEELARKIVGVLSKDAIPAILDPRFISAEAAESQMRDGELVIGVSINGDARAYPINMLSEHEIVNDVVGGELIAVTWWPLCYSGIVYARQLDEMTLTFGVSGKLIMNALVMYDHQTDSLWSHFTGDAVQGLLVGTKLEILPAIQTLWGQWKELHPDTLVLDKGGWYQYDVYQGYYESTSAGIIGQTRKDDRLHWKQSVLGVLIDGVAKAYARSDLYDHPVVNDSVAGKDLVVTYNPESITAGVFSREVAGRTLTFRPIGSKESDTPLMVDQETSSRWLLLTGEAIEGVLKGTKLERIPYNYAFWFAWKDYYPSTQLFLTDDLPS